MTTALTLLAAAAGVVILLAIRINEAALSPASWIRAKDLFLSKLTEDERRRWASRRRLTIVGKSGRHYTLMPYESFNIRSDRYAYCLRVLGRLPAYDKLLAQRLLLECDERAFLTLANRRELRPVEERD